MGMFGSLFGRKNEAQTGAEDPAGLSDVTVTPERQVQSPRGGLFGGEWDSRRRALLFAGIADAIDPLTMNPSGGGLSANVRKQYDDQADEKARNDAFSAAYDPVTGRVDIKKVIEQYTKAGRKVPDAIWSAAAKPEEIETKTIGNSLLQLQPDGTWKEVYAAPVDPLEQEKTRAQTEYYRSGAGLRGQQEEYYGVKTQQPYAPKGAPRAGAAAKPPTGFILDP